MLKKMIKVLYLLLVLIFCVANFAFARVSLDEMLQNFEGMLNNVKSASELMDKAIEQSRGGIPNFDEFNKTMMDIAQLDKKFIELSMKLSDDYDYYLQQSLSIEDAVKFAKIKEIFEQIQRLQMDRIPKMKLIKRFSNKEAVISLIKTISISLETYHLTNEKYPYTLSEINKASEPYQPFLDTELAQFYTVTYKLNDNDHYELNVTPKQDLIKEGDILNENYYLTQNGRLLINSASGELIEAITIK